MTEVNDLLEELKGMAKKKSEKKVSEDLLEKKVLEELPEKQVSEKKDFLSQNKTGKKSLFPEQTGKFQFKENAKKPSEIPEINLTEKSSNFYYFFEDKYYNLMDKINPKIPVYKIIDPIDKVVPSFVLFSGIILILLFLAVYFVFLPALMTETGSLTITLTKENSDEILSDYYVFVSVDGNKSKFTADENAQIVLSDLELYSVIKIEVIDVPGYKDFNTTTEITKKENFLVIELKEQAASASEWETKTITFRNKQTQSIVRELLRVSFECSEGNSFLEIQGQTSLNKSIDSGSVNLRIKNECKAVFVSVESANFEEIELMPLETNTVFLVKKEEDKGTIKIKVFDESNQLISIPLKYSLFEESDPFNAVSGFSDRDITGEKIFEHSPGNFFVKVFDSSDFPVYSCSNASETKELIAGNTIILSVNCSGASSEDSIFVEVTDKNSNAAVNSKIELRKKVNNFFDFVAVKENVSSAFFAVDEGDYVVLVSSSGYLPYEAEKALIKGDSLKVELIKLTEKTSGKADVNVFDFEGNPASGGIVYLRYAEGLLKDLRTPYSGIIGFSGEVLINGVKPAKYYAEALSSKQNGFSVSKNIDANKITGFEVNMQKTRGILELNVINLNSASIENFDVVFFYSSNNHKVLETDYLFSSSDETFSFEPGEYFAVISKENFISVRSANFSVLSNQKTIVNVVLIEPDSDKGISVDFIGLFNKYGYAVDSIDLGKEYSAQFNLAVNPDQNLNVFYFNFLVGTGKQDSIEDDYLFISGFDDVFDGLAEIKKTTSFTENYNYDFETNLTQGDSKTVLVEFDDFNKRDFNYSAFTVQVKFKLKEKLFDADNLILFFKALAAAKSRQDPKYFFDPEDENEFSSLNARTYSNQKIKELNLCDSDFCFSFLVSSDSADASCEVIDYGLISGIKLNCPYKLSSFAANYKTDYDEIDFSLNKNPVEAVEFKEYFIKSKNEELSENSNNQEIKESFSFNEKEIIFSELNFVPLKLVNLAGNSPEIKNELFNGSSSLAKDALELSIRSDLELNILSDPEEITAFTETTLLVEVLDKTGNPVENARVDLEIDGTLTATIYTVVSGEAFFEGTQKIPGLNPGKLIKITAEKDDVIASKEISVRQADTFSFSPEFLLYSFSFNDSALKTKQLVFSDSSDGLFSQKIVSYSVDFSNSEYFDLNKISFNGTERSFTVEGILTNLTLALDTNKTAGLTSNISVQANLNLEIEIDGYNFTKIIPIVVLIKYSETDPELLYSDYVKVFFASGTQNEVTNDNRVLVSLFSDEINSVNQFDLKTTNFGSAKLEIIDVELQSENSVYLDLDEMKTFIKSIEETMLSSDDELTVDFKAVLNNAASAVTEKQTETGIIFFVVEVNGIPDVFSVPFKVEIIPEDDSLSVFPEEFSFVFFIEEDDSKTNSINLKSSSSLFNLELNDVSFELTNYDFASVNSFDFGLPLTLNNTGRDFVFTLNLTQIGKELESSRLVNGFLNLGYSVKGKNLTKTVPVKVFINTPEKEIESEYFDSKACLGEGALNQTKGNFDVSFWIGCDLDKTALTDCSMQKPKIKLDWKFSSFSVDSFNGKGICTKTIDADNYYSYCDASQFSMELVYRIIKFKELNSNETTFNYKAVLISDNFSADFFADFDDWAVNTLLEAPTKYTSETSYDLIRKYFAENKIHILENGNSVVESPGWYDVTVNVLDESLEIELTLIKNSIELEQDSGSEDSMLYYIPFDGLVGLQNQDFNRIDYGSSFDVSSLSGEFKVNEENRIFSSEKLTGFDILGLTQANDFNELNSALNKGTLMEITKGLSNTRTIKFYPSYATPLILEANLNEISDEALIYYSVVDAENKEELIEESLIEWKGTGKQCLDFSGEFLNNNLYSDLKPDSLDESNLGLNNYENAFKLSWLAPLKTGKAFFKSVVFSPANIPLTYLKIISYPQNPFIETRFYSKNDSSNNANNWIPLEGVPNVIFNDSPNNKSDSLKDLFDLIDSGYACVKNQGNTSYILWNQQKLLEELTAKEDLLNIESQCIK